MHEFSITESIVDAVLEEIAKLGPEPPRLLETRITAGQLRQIVPEFMETAYEVLTRGTPAEGSKLTINVVPAEVKCPDCGWHGSVDGAYFRCHTCGAPTETIAGMELNLESMELEE